MRRYSSDTPRDVLRVLEGLSGTDLYMVRGCEPEFVRYPEVPVAARPDFDAAVEAALRAALVA